MTCPRCGHQQTESAAVECAACGVILAKATPLRARRDGAAADANGALAAVPLVDGVPAAPGASDGDAAGQSLIELAGAALFDEDRADSASLVGRALLLLLLLLGTWRFATASVISNVAGQSWLHLIDLVFHEAGHVLFLPFGEFMTAFGGSLTQLLIPALLLVVFLTKHRDPFGAAVCWWWLGENLVDLAPYINDARNLQLVLLGGKTGAEVEGHDWEHILTMLGWLHLDHTLGRLAHATGSIIMITALLWGARLLLAHWRRARASGSDSGAEGAIL